MLAIILTGLVTVLVGFLAGATGAALVESIRANRERREARWDRERAARGE